jgi:HAD superfamily hydrolase (TIGR01509 family)
MSIDEHKIFIFDLDGTIIDSEKIHCQAYNMQLKKEISYDAYCEIFHTDKKEAFCKKHNIDFKKKDEDFKQLYAKHAKFIDGFEEFFKYLLQNGKTTCIVTNSSRDRCQFVKTLHPILNNIDLWITKDDVTKPKPNPEGYIRALQELLDETVHLEEVVIFEDSLIGSESIKNIPCVSKIFINSNAYGSMNLQETFLSHHNFYDVLKSTRLKVETDDIDDYDTIFRKYENALCLLKQHAKNIINIIIPLIIQHKTIFILGVGKSGLIAQKCVSTWNSMGISAYSVNVNDLFHGDFGKIIDNSVILYISNSGNTYELINVAKHIKNEFNVTQIILSNNHDNALKEYCDYNFSLLNDNKIYEIDDINRAPTTSSFVFLSFLDILGIQIRKHLGKFTEKDFVRFHPGGTLGKKHIIDSVVIVACGRGIRLHPYTIQFPKCLVNLDNDNILCKQIKYWSKYTKSFVILIENKYNEIVKFYCDHMDIEYKIRNVCIDNHQENSYTIQQGLGKDYNDKNIIITWCDILFTHEIDIHSLNTNIIFTYGNECRYHAEINKIEKVNSGGNVIGCFFVQNYHNLEVTNTNLDFCDVFIDNFGNFNTYKLESVIDIGDLQKLQSYQSSCTNKYKTRYFNKITDTHDGYLKKQSLDKNGKSLIVKEKQYYKMISTTNIKHLFPTILEYDRDYFIIQKLPADPIYTIINHEDYLTPIFNALCDLHEEKRIIIDDNEFYANLKIEFYDKIIQRCKNIKSLINYLKIARVSSASSQSLKIHHVFEDILTSLFDDIYAYYNDKEKVYHIIHGDCQFSNILKAEDDKIIFIDPRGYFGKRQFYGIKEYDYSKVLYALSGYDSFNNKDDYYFDYDSDTQTIDLHICHTDLMNYKHLFKDFDICLKMMIIHWFGLAEYNKNNIHKCIAAFYHAIYLYHLYCL